MTAVAKPVERGWNLAGYVLSICESARGGTSLTGNEGIARNLWLGRLPS